MWLQRKGGVVFQKVVLEGRINKASRAMKIRRRYPNDSNSSHSIDQGGRTRDLLGLCPSQASKLLLPARISSQDIPGRSQCMGWIQSQCHTQKWYQKKQQKQSIPITRDNIFSARAMKDDTATLTPALQCLMSGHIWKNCNQTHMDVLQGSS